MDPLDTMTAADWRRCYDKAFGWAKTSEAELHELRQTSRRRELELVDRLRRREERVREVEELLVAVRFELDT